MTSVALPPALATRTILFGTDFAPAANRALPYAASLASRLGCRLLILHAVDKPLTLAQESQSRAAAGHDSEKFEDEIERLRGAADLRDLSCEVLIRRSEVWEAVADIVDEKEVGLVIVGTRALTGWQKFRFGSVAEDLMRALDCPVMTIGPRVTNTGEPFQRILYATDFNQSSNSALPYAVALANADNATLTMLHVVGRVTEEKLKSVQRHSAEQLAALLPASGSPLPRVGLAVEPGVPAEQIVRVADSKAADLIVLGAHPAGRIATYLPSSAHYVLQHAHCPVLTVRGNS